MVTHSPLQKASPVPGRLRSRTPSRTPQLVFYRIDRSQVALARVPDLYITRADKHQLLHWDPRLVLIFPVKDSDPPPPPPPPPPPHSPQCWTIHLSSFNCSWSGERGRLIHVACISSTGHKQIWHKSVICRCIDPLFFSAFPLESDGIHRTMSSPAPRLAVEVWAVEGGEQGEKHVSVEENGGMCVCWGCRMEPKACDSRTHVTNTHKTSLRARITTLESNTMVSLLFLPPGGDTTNLCVPLAHTLLLFKRTITRGDKTFLWKSGNISRTDLFPGYEANVAFAPQMSAVWAIFTLPVSGSQNKSRLFSLLLSTSFTDFSFFPSPTAIYTSTSRADAVSKKKRKKKKPKLHHGESRWKNAAALLVVMNVN